MRGATRIWRRSTVLQTWRRAGNPFKYTWVAASAAATPPPSSVTLEVQMTSFRCRFIHVSHSTRWPLYVSPLFSSTSCAEGGQAGARVRCRATGKLRPASRASESAPDREQQCISVPAGGSAPFSIVTAAACLLCAVCNQLPAGTEVIALSADQHSTQDSLYTGGVSARESRVYEAGTLGNWTGRLGNRGAHADLRDSVRLGKHAMGGGQELDNSSGKRHEETNDESYRSRNKEAGAL